MKHILRTLVIAITSFFLCSVPAFASFNNADIVNANKGNPPSKNSTTHGFKFGQAKCVWNPGADTATDGTIAAHTCDLTIPKKAIVTFAAYKVLTTFTSATDAATIAISIVGANDVVSAAAISTGTTWDAVSIPIETIPKIETSTTWLDTLTADRDVTFTVAVEALTAGKMVVWVQWLYYGDT